MLHALCSDTPYGQERIEFCRSFEGHKWVRGGDKLANGKEMSPAAAAKKKHGEQISAREESDVRQTSIPSRVRFGAKAKGYPI